MSTRKPGSSKKRRRRPRRPPTEERAPSPAPVEPAPPAFARVLVAEAGEAAARVARTCRQLGIEVLAVHPEGHVDPLHAEACDASLALPVDARGAHDPAAVVEAAVAAGADAVHPGYGRGDHYDLAERCARAGLGFAGAAPEVMRAAYDRMTLRVVAEHLGVRAVDGSDEPVTDAEAAARAAREIDYPVVVRSVVGPHIVSAPADDEEELVERFHGCERALRAYGVDPVVLCVERAIERPRRVSIVLARDGHGDVVALGEVEHSLDHDGRPLLAEAPSPALVAAYDGEAQRETMFDVAIRVVAQLGATGVAVVRFLLPPDRRIYLDAVDLGLPVDHPVVELITDIDLVAVQLDVAAGRPLPEDLGLRQPSGHAIAAWLVGRAESEATVEDVRWPPAPAGKLRFDASVRPGDAVRPGATYALARVAAYAPIRHQAVLTLDRVLAATVAPPLETNVGVLRRVLGDEAFRFGQYDVEFVDRLLSSAPAT